MMMHVGSTRSQNWGKRGLVCFVRASTTALVSTLLTLQTASVLAQETRIEIWRRDGSHPANICITDRSDSQNFLLVCYNNWGSVDYSQRPCNQVRAVESILHIAGVHALIANTGMDATVDARLTYRLTLHPSPRDITSFYRYRRFGFLRFVDMRYSGYLHSGYSYPEMLFGAGGVLSVRFPVDYVRWWEGQTRLGERPRVIRSVLSLSVFDTIPDDTLFEFSQPHDPDGFYGAEQPYQRVVAIYDYPLEVIDRHPNRSVEHRLDLFGNLSFHINGNVYGRGDPYAFYPFRITQAARHGLISIQPLRHVDPFSVNPVGVPEIGENEYVYQDSPPLLRIPVFAWLHDVLDAYDDPLGWNTPTFRRFYDPPNHQEMQWWANKLNFAVVNYRGEPPPGAAPLAGKRIENVYGIAPWSRMGNNSVRGLAFTGSTLPPLEYFGRYDVQLRYNHNSRFPNVLVHSTPVEVFFPANGGNHPQDGPPGVAGYWRWQGDRGDWQEQAPYPTPNWFYYYWAAIVRDNPHLPWIANIRYAHLLPESEEPLPLGFYSSGQSYVNVTSALANRLSTRSSGLRLYLFRLDDTNRIQRVDFLHVYGYHAFQFVVAHEFAHKYLYESGIVGLPDSDGDGLRDDWEIALRLDPTERRTLRFVYNTDYPHNDQEFLCDVIAYGFLLPREQTWQSDWADIGLQKGVPISPFPWRYDSSGTNRSRYTDLIDSIDDLLRR